MQTVLDSLCRCFGEPMKASDLERFESVANRPNTAVPATPDGTRRTKNMKLQERQWDTLFDCNGGNNVNCVTPSPQKSQSSSNSSSSRGKRTARVAAEDMTVEQAQAVAKAKLAANGGPPPPTPTAKGPPKRKRATPDDIFRSKGNLSPPAASAANGQQPNYTSCNPSRPKDAFSRFLTNHPVLANSLCFATPIRGSEDEPNNIPLDTNSVVSDTNTLNTAEDTITSTLYYEQVKLAGLKQRNPPMPLFGAYEVKPSDDIRNVAASDSHSSIMMQSWVRQNPDMLKVEPLESERLKLEAVQENAPVVSKPARKRGNADNTNDDDIPPEMVVASSDSTTQRSV